MDRILIKLWAMLASTVALFGILLTFAATAFAQPTVTVQLQPDDQMAEFVAAVEAIVAQYPTNPFVITSDVGGQYGLTDENYVGAKPGWMIINRTYSTNPAYLQKAFNYDLLSYFHSPGCSAQTYLGIHEAAHQIDYTHGMRARQVALQWAATIPDERAIELSGYSFDELGNFAPAEALAEAFAAVKCDPRGSTPAEYDLYNILINTQ